jgi:hypothetical protein
MCRVWLNATGHGGNAMIKNAWPGVDLFAPVFSFFRKSGQAVNMVN